MFLKFRNKFFQKNKTKNSAEQKIISSAEFYLFLFIYN